MSIKFNGHVGALLQASEQSKVTVQIVTEQELGGKDIFFTMPKAHAGFWLPGTVVWITIASETEPAPLYRRDDDAFSPPSAS